MKKRDDTSNNRSGFQRNVIYCITHGFYSAVEGFNMQVIFYYSQQEITLWRKGDIVRKSMSQQAAIASQRFEGSNSGNMSAQAKEDSN